ncbi:Maintenance of telomere capping protein 1 [Pseudocercospora fuligena]|uniref:Maintenance of telomere capping protein 1 n=1 Tax=Pseudocercospora fuligena TaxID=685502 RepID=A0A8H6RDC3_9PEZI|nr:Maintenance of telomere capping protein 1 [Pseudocercospora fuligena]
MARKADDLLADLDSLGIEEQQPPPANKAKPGAKAATATTNDDDDALADLEKQLAAKPAGTSRPSTPRLSSSTTSGTNKSPKRPADYTPATTSQGSSERNSSEDRHRATAAQTRSSGEGTRSFHTAQTPAVENVVPESSQKAAGGGGGWWGSMFNAASAAVKQAESLAKNIQTNEEAQKWVEQIRGNANLASLQNISADLRSRALPTFTSLISHIAPPISAHERLQIHTTHDIQNYPSLDPLIYDTFSRIMAQVEGGDLLVIQRGSESRNRSSSDVQGYKGGVLGGGNRWTDGPWWREESSKRSLGTISGLKEGTRLARVQAESYAKEFFDSKGGVEEVAKRATETLSESNPVRSSDIFLAIQAVAFKADKDNFAEDSHAEKDTTVVTPEDPEDEQIVFAIYLHDPLHSISFKALSQPFPQKWADWLDAEASAGGLPESIMEIIQTGGVDPREWVAEWMEEILSLAVGVVAQQYVAKRMGVGEGGIGRGKKRAEEDATAGEAARAV